MCKVPTIQAVFLEYSRIAGPWNFSNGPGENEVLKHTAWEQSLPEAY